ncbi:conserved hypothetical protein [Anaeromyxobacter dehalogenans 2CP-1]|uniref:Uncharacterized protein n=1 Tax=Anaeromyxobacter dehalogenans (strain ATCC BAA-258 / DSM 21875 / 2CP-1) TaxID=455488 RepID=B8JCX1_ANAD2|nr:glycosyltransferase [Anaeromyxobacter dehalogenans]ACL63999.1 conserved hypothetical protein [Anaeromyxobacter dehalogenans 2CP-1]
MRHAPVAAFVFRRPARAQQMLASLAANPEVRDTQVVVFSDGPRSAADAAAVDETRRVVQAAGLPHLEVVARERNLGLARSVREGVTRLCREHGRAIVLEDDLVLSPTFLEYMNAALDRYSEDERVYAVSGFQYPVRLRAPEDAVFLPFISSWGWATWERAWRHLDGEATGRARLLADPALRQRFDLGGRYGFSGMLEDQVSGRSDSWAILWYLTVFMRGGLALFPARSLVENRGFEAGGTHCPEDAPRHIRAVAQPFRVRTWPEPRVDAAAYRRVTRCMGFDATIPGQLLALGERLLRRLRASGR